MGYRLAREEGANVTFQEFDQDLGPVLPLSGRQICGPSGIGFCMACFLGEFAVLGKPVVSLF